MRVFGLLLALLLSSLPMSAQTWAELGLNDGRVLKAVKFVSQSPDSILVRHSEGIAQVKKELLPVELQKLYPIDRASARARDARLAEAQAELLRKKAIADRNAQTVYEQRRDEQRQIDAGLAAERAQRDASLQELRDSGTLSGELQIVSSGYQLSSAVLHVKNIGERSTTFDWRQVEAQTRLGEKLTATAAMPRDKDRLDWTIEPGATRVFEIGFGTYRMGSNNGISSVRWK